MPRVSRKAKDTAKHPCCPAPAPPEEGVVEPTPAPAARKRRVRRTSREFDVASATVRMRFYEEGKPEALFDVSLESLSQEACIRAALYGIACRLDKSRNREHAIAAFEAGEWPEDGPGRKPAKPKHTQVVRAIARVQGWPVERAASRWEELTSEQRKQVQGDPRIKAARAAIKAEDEASTSGAPLDELLGGPLEQQDVVPVGMPERGLDAPGSSGASPTPPWAGGSNATTNG